MVRHLEMTEGAGMHWSAEMTEALRDGLHLYFYGVGATQEVY